MPTLKNCLSACLLFVALASGAGAQTAVPLLEPKPVFIPGMYETESRNSAFKDRGIKSKTCFASADFDTFRDETMAQYQKAPQFVKDCRLSDTKSLSNGFAFAMACKGVKTVITFHFTKDLVSSTIETLIVDRPKYSSSILSCRGGSASVRVRCRERRCSEHRCRTRSTSPFVMPGHSPSKTSVNALMAGHPRFIPK